MRSFVSNAFMVHTRIFGPSLSDVTAMPEQSNFTVPIARVNNDPIKISAILLQPSFSEGSKLLNEVPLRQNVSENVLEERMDSVSKPSSPSSKVASAGKPGDISVVYVCELTKIRGKFDREKALAFGVQSGPKYGQLEKGHSVKSDCQDIMVSSRNIMKLRT
ncbi:hypothetical protein TorRG33x02_156570 [Trema orientale]|uniref:Uncharacterized protein n=1 Tax=Trema orientale TaxID=63057 RepID=A0A2P5ESS5_TREOI|nr:hypothetical protein TorRG33x02_156570 [Trema orientale]